MTDDATENRTQVGNARRLVARHGPRIRFLHARRRWLVNVDGRRWTVDETGMMQRLAKETVKSIYAEAAVLEGAEERQRLATWASRSESLTELTAMIELAASEPGIPVTLAVLDADPWLLNVENGTVDLRTGKLHPHDPTQLITKMAGSHFDPDAKCPRFLAFLSRVLVQAELVDYLQLVVGLMLTGVTREQCFFLLHGAGANGKTTFIEVVRALLGDYAVHADVRTFMTRRGSGPRNDLACLAGARMVTAVETAKGQRLDDGLMKQLTGGDPVTARFLYAENVTFRPEFKLILACNHKPVVKDNGPAMWRRVRLIPFTATIPESEQAKDFRQRVLEPELPGILAWAIRGCLDWQRTGLPTPPVVDAATQAYRDENDELTPFFAERCEVATGLRAPATLLYNDYKDWARANGVEVASQREFGEYLGSIPGLARVKSRSGIVWHGLRLVHLVHLREPSNSISSHARAGEESIQNAVHKGAQGAHDELELAESAREGTA